MRKLLMVLAALFVLFVSLPARADQITQVTLRIEGVHSDEDGVAIVNALKEIPNIKVATRPTVQNPTVIVVPLANAKYDLGDLARTIAGTKTPNQAKGAPAAALLLTYKANAKPTALTTRELEAICTKLKGVNAKKCRLDADRKELQIHLDGHGGATLAEIMAAVPMMDTEYYPKR